MKKAGCILIVILDVAFMLWLLFMVLSGNGENSHFIGLIVLAPLGYSYIKSLINLIKRK